jgi:hypothetical protein
MAAMFQKKYQNRPKIHEKVEVLDGNNDDCIDDILNDDEKIRPLLVTENGTEYSQKRAEQVISFSIFQPQNKKMGSQMGSQMGYQLPNGVPNGVPNGGPNWGKKSVFQPQNKQD